MDRTSQSDVSQHLREAGDSLADSRREGQRAGRAAIQSIEQEWAHLRNELNELTNNGALSQTPEVQALLHRLRDGVAHASDMISDTSRHASQRISRVASDADDYVHEEPWKVATIAALGGIAIGLLVGRR